MGPSAIKVCTQCKRMLGEQHRPSCHRKGVVTENSVYTETGPVRPAESSIRFSPEWVRPLSMGIQALVSTPMVRSNIHPDHIKDTPQRVSKFYKDFLWGYDVTAAQSLATTSGDKGFEEASYNQMVLEVDIDFVSLCSHHLLPFVGKAHFGYLPDKRVVGVSKIARLIDVFAHRLQLQEQLTQQVVNAFQEEVQPRGCALVMEAEHLCMTIRGVKKPGTITVTNALKGIFLDDHSAKQEFFDTIHRHHRRR